MRAATALTAALLVWGAAAAHAYLESAAPAAGAATASSPTEIVLTFSAPFETGFSTFELFLVPTTPDQLPADVLAPTDAEWGRLVSVVVLRVAQWRRDPRAGTVVGVAVEGPAGRGALREIRLRPLEPLPPGVYAVVWEALATDGHAMHDQHVFVVAETP